MARSGILYDSVQQVGCMLLGVHRHSRHFNGVAGLEQAHASESRHHGDTLSLALGTQQWTQSICGSCLQTILFPGSFTS